MKVCPSCDAVLSDKDRICGVCGTNLDHVTTQTLPSALRQSEEIEHRSEMETSQVERTEYLNYRKHLIEWSLFRLIIAPIFAIIGFIGLINYSTTSGMQDGLFTLYLVIMLIGFGGVLHDLMGKDDPPFGYMKTVWMIGRAKDVADEERQPESKEESK